MDELQLKSIIEAFDFEKQEQTEVENSVCEYYEKTIIGIERPLLLEIQVMHKPEEPDQYLFYMLSSTHGTAHKIRVNIESAFDLTMLINLLNSNE